MGNEIGRDTCPEKYCKTENPLLSSLPVLAALVVVAFMSGNLFAGSGMSTVVTLVIECIFVGGLYAFFTVFTNGGKKRMAETYISVCENGICGICPVNGFKNRNFEITYENLRKLEVKGERLFIKTDTEKVVLTLNDAAGIAALIREKNNQV